MGKINKPPMAKALLQGIGLAGGILCVLMGLLTLARVQPPSTSGMIVFSSARHGQDDLYLMAWDGSAQRRLTDDLAGEWSASWSPDGQWIVFTVDDNNNQDIYKIRPDGSGRTQLTSAPSLDSYPVWSPDSQQIAFVSDRGGGFSGIYRMAADGGGAESLLQPDWGDVWGLDWSHDGGQLLFQARNTGYRTNLYSLDVVTREVRWLLDGDFDAFFPSLSPDNRYLVYNAFDRRSNDEVFVMDLQRQTTWQLTAHRSEDRMGDFSASGEEIVFMSRRNTHWDVYRVPTFGGPLVRLTDNPSDSWSPSVGPPMEMQWSPLWLWELGLGSIVLGSMGSWVIKWRTAVRPL